MGINDFINWWIGRAGRFSRLHAVSARFDAAFAELGKTRREALITHYRNLYKCDRRRAMELALSEMGKATQRPKLRFDSDSPR
jgi:hypothetical protein